MRSAPLNNTNRLFAAAEVLLKAINSPSGNSALVPLYIEAMSPQSGPPPWAFTQFELNDALDFLVRMGLTRKQPPTRSASGARVRRRRV